MRVGAHRAPFKAPVACPGCLQVSDAIAAYLRAADTSKYNEVIAKANEVGAQGAPAAAVLVVITHNQPDGPPGSTPHMLAAHQDRAGLVFRPDCSA